MVRKALRAWGPKQCSWDEIDAVLGPPLAGDLAASQELAPDCKDPFESVVRACCVLCACDFRGACSEHRFAALRLESQFGD
eukprot:13987174-Alexandrium_andersonii.AAC.1